MSTNILTIIYECKQSMLQALTLLLIHAGGYSYDVNALFPKTLPECNQRHAGDMGSRAFASAYLGSAGVRRCGGVP